MESIMSYRDLIPHHHLQSSPIGSAHTNLSVSPTFECALDVSLGCLVLSAFPFQFPQLLSNLHPPQLDGAKSAESGGWGTTAILLLAKNSCTV
jgi:hypothetical protein